MAGGAKKPQAAEPVIEDDTGEKSLAAKTLAQNSTEAAELDIELSQQGHDGTTASAADIVAQAATDGTVPAPSAGRGRRSAEKNARVNDPHEQERWMARRRESHKEVERRRRDNINVGIMELAKVVPDCGEKKGNIVHKAVEYIQYLQKTNLLTVEKWRDEKKEYDEKVKQLQERVQKQDQEINMLKLTNAALTQQPGSGAAAGAAGTADKRRRND